MPEGEWLHEGPVQTVRDGLQQLWQWIFITETLPHRCQHRWQSTPPVLYMVNTHRHAHTHTHIHTHTHTQIQFKAIISNFLGWNINDHIQPIFHHDLLDAAISRPSKKRVSVGTRPLSVIGWNNVYYGLVWLVVPFVIVCDLGAQDAYRTFFWRPAYGAGS